MAVCVQRTFLQVENKDGQRAGGGHLGIQLAQRACGCVAGIGHQGLAVGLALGIEPFEHLAGHIDLAAHGEIQRFGQGQGNIEYGTDVLGHVLAGGSVAAGRALHQHAALVA